MSVTGWSGPVSIIYRSPLYSWNISECDVKQTDKQTNKTCMEGCIGQCAAICCAEFGTLIRRARKRRSGVLRLSLTIYISCWSSRKHRRVVKNTHNSTVYSTKKSLCGVACHSLFHLTNKNVVHKIHYIGINIMFNFKLIKNKNNRNTWPCILIRIMFFVQILLKVRN